MKTENPTNEQIRLAIAASKGFAPVEIDYWGHETGLQKELGMQWFDDAIETDNYVGLHWVNIEKHSSEADSSFPNWPNSIADAIELFDEMRARPALVSIQGDHNGYTCFEHDYPTSDTGTICEFADTKERAIALAYCKVYGITFEGAQL